MSALPTLRVATAADREFLAAVYASTRAEELAQVPWSDAEKAAFLAMQSHAQETDYRGRFPAEAFHVIELAGAPVGRLYVHRGETEIELIDIALLPPHRGRGLGTSLIRPLLDESDASGRPVVLYVEKFNRVQSLYRRLGFAEVQDSGMYLKLARAAHGAKQTPAT